MERFKNFFRKKSLNMTDVIGWQELGQNSTLRFYKDNQYENGFSSIRAIANDFIQVLPYGIDKTGNKIQSSIIDKLYHPNQDMSSLDFREAIAVMSLVHPKVYILHWHYEDGILVQGGATTEDNIAGYTFLEDVCEVIVDGETFYSVGTKRYTKQDVIVLRSTNPYNLSKGFSPAQAARRWTKLDDYVAEYQSGFFENGAVPAGMFIIRAKTVGDYKAIKESMQEKHRGAGKNNNVTYNYQPLDANGQAQLAQIEWIPFNVQSKDMALKEIFEQVNKKIDSAYGVPASIRGVNDSNTYASVRVDEQIMARYTVNPFLLKIWTRFTHELNRVTGGLGFAITYDYSIPQVADENKVLAETKQIEANIINNLSGTYKLPSIVKAFGFSAKYLELEKETKMEQQDNPDIDDGSEVEDSPEQPIIGYYKGLKAKQLSAVDAKLYEDKVSSVVVKFMTEQVETAINDLDDELKSKAYGDTSKDIDAEMAVAILASLLPLISIYGNKSRDDGVQLILDAGLNADTIPVFSMTEAQKSSYLTYLKRVATGYNDETAVQIRQILEDGILNGASKNDLERSLKDIILGDSNKYRVERIARTEVGLSEGRASVQAMQNIVDDTGYDVYKVWNTVDGECEYCKAMNGTRVKVSENFVDMGGTVDGEDGHKYIADFKDTESADLHPNCKCYVTYEVAK